MNLIIRKQQMLALFILAFLALVVVSLILFSAVAHVDIWHIFSTGRFVWMSGG